MSQSPMHEEKNLGKYPQQHLLPRFGFIFKSGNPPSENQYYNVSNTVRTVGDSHF